MIQERAVVEQLTDTGAWVSTQRQSTCAGCAANKACGTAALSRLLGQRRSRVQVLTEQPLVPGEPVLIGLSEQALLRGSLMVYGLPLAGLIGGSLLGQALAGLALPGALVGLALAAWQLGRYRRAIATDARYQPIVLRRLGAAPQESLS